MSKYSCFDVKTKDHICSLVLNRPNELNTMTRDFWVELGDALEEINRDSDVRVVILSSTGKHFCAGMDLSAFSNGVDDIPDDSKPDHARVGEVLYKVIICLSNFINSAFPSALLMSNLYSSIFVLTFSSNSSLSWLMKLVFS